MVGKGRLEAFSDGVIAIIITIMVLELRPPEGATWEAMTPLIPEFCAYALSFIYLAIYWNNHHYLIHAAGHVTAPILWANLHLLFWLSLVPFVTGWLGHSPFDAVPTAAYGIVMVCDGIAYWILERTIVAAAGRDSRMARAVGSDAKGLISIAMYGAAIAFAFFYTAISDAIFVGVALMWLVPDRRLQSVVHQVERA